MKAFITFLLCALAIGGWRLWAAPANKRVEIDKTHQVLRAFEGDQLILESPISTGKQGKATPNGSFQVGRKLRMHYSSLYENAPMPFSVQLAGNYFIHGFKSVPARPASHGCIRLPIEVAEKFFHWVEPGTPVEIIGKWPGFLTEEGKEVRQEVLSQ